MASFYTLTLGCKLNQLESESITEAFKNSGFDQFEIKNEDNCVNSPSVIIINTCTVTSKADQKARRVIRKAMHDYPDACVIVTGCYAKLNEEDILRLETGSRRRLVIIDKEKIIKLPQYIYEKIKNGNDLNDLFVPAFLNKHDKNDLFAFNPQQFSKHTRSFLKIQDGCDKQCTYCKIRLARGKSVSLEKNEVLSRLRLLEQTHAETVLTGVNICQYREQGKNDREESKESGLVKLLDYLLSGTKKIMIRLSSLAPESIDEDLCRILSHPRIQPHFHLSVQSCSNIILQKMGRLYNAETVERAVSLLRGIKDDPFLACDIITGFPCETKIEFEKTCDFCRKLDFAWIHVFPFSKRKGTPAFSFTDNVRENEVTRRVKILTDLAKRGKSGYINRWLGREVNVLLEKNKKLNTSLFFKEKNENETAFFFKGISDNYLKLLVCGDMEIQKHGEILRCRLIKEADSKDNDAIASVI